MSVGKLDFPVEKYKLPNGMRVLLHEDHSSPLVSVYQIFNVGSKDEKVGQKGLAHFFEHMLFKGTKKYPRDKFEKLIKSNGGSNNAFTSYDMTAYHEHMPAGKLEIILDIESDRMKNLIIKKEDVDYEREVVKSEKRYSYDDNPSGLSSNKLMSLVFKGTSYEDPIIGYTEDLNNTSLREFKEFYKKYYVPNNSILVVAGDFDSKKAKKWIREYYSSWPEKKILRLPEKPLKEQKKKRALSLKKKIQSPFARMGFAIPSALSKDVRALELLSQILGQGESSRLHKRFVDKGKASSMVSYAYPLMRGGIFEIFMQLPKKGNISKVIEELRGEVEKLREVKVSDKELKKAKNQFLRYYISSLKKVKRRAYFLGESEFYYGDYKKGFELVDAYEKVTREDVMNVAKKYLKPERENLVRVLPL